MNPLFWLNASKVSFTFTARDSSSSVDRVIYWGGRWGGGGMVSVVRELEFKSKDPAFDPLVGQGETVPLIQLLCRLVCV